MPTEWLSAYTRALEEKDPERLESLAMKARDLIVDHIEKTEAEIVYLKDAVRLLESYLDAARRTRE